jgi:Asp-tRNA(Asn)/Glu-tRNA(Gln) amidotransferase A subunit family amidase
MDAIVTPSTGCTAPLLPADALRSGESNLELTGEIMRFAFPANLSGLPAVSVPVGYDGDGLPIGLQLMGRPWQEHLLLRVATALESRVERRAPRVGYRYFE